MSALAVERTPRIRRRRRDEGRDQLHGGAAFHGDADDQRLDPAGSTLGCLIEHTWAQLEEHSAARCPVCGGTMLRAVGTRSGACTRCRATLS